MLRQPIDDEAVVDDFVTHIDGRAEAFERELDDLDRPVDARAKAARRRDQHPQGEGGFSIRSGHVRLRLQP